MDLQELLQSLGFGHWHKFLLTLFARYAGWLTHYWMEERFEVDLWPVEDVIKVLVGFPRAQAGNDLALALALSQCDFFARQARDTTTGADWDARMEPYSAFVSRHRAEPYWGLEIPWQPGEFANWALSQLPPRDRPIAEGDAGP